MFWEFYSWDIDRAAANRWNVRGRINGANIEQLYQEISEGTVKVVIRTEDYDLGIEHLEIFKVASYWHKYPDADNMIWLALEWDSNHETRFTPKEGNYVLVFDEDNSPLLPGNGGERFPPDIWEAYNKQFDKPTFQVQFYIKPVDGHHCNLFVGNALGSGSFWKKMDVKVESTIDTEPLPVMDDIVYAWIYDYAIQKIIKSIKFYSAANQTYICGNRIMDIKDKDVKEMEEGIVDKVVKKAKRALGKRK